jgi:hypothetical protein
MPGYTPKPNPITSRLPTGVRSVVEEFFPPNDVVSSAIPITSVSGPVQKLIKAVLEHRATPLTKGLTETLSPFSGSVAKGRALAQDIGGEIADYLPEPYPITAHPTVQEMWHLLRKVPKGPDPLKVMAGEKISSRPPMSPSIKAPEGFTFNRSGRTPTIREQGAFGVKRDPLVTEMTDRYRTFDNEQARMPKFKQTTGKWNRFNDSRKP